MDPPVGNVDRARDVLATFVRKIADERFQDCQRRSDLAAVAELLALAAYLEALDWDGATAKLIDAAAPTRSDRPFPSPETRARLEAFAEAPGPIASFLDDLIAEELSCTLDLEIRSL